MKRFVTLTAVLLLTCKISLGQINENDTTLTRVSAKNGSVWFQADVFPDYVQLQWTKGPDDHIAYYELYRSSDGVAYNIVKQFHPQTFDANDNSFSFRDDDPLRGRNYYRLVGYEKSTQEKRTVELIAEYRNQPRKLQPTLVVKGNQLNILNYDGQELQLSIYSTTGSPVVQNRIVNSSVVHVPELSPVGMYVYQLVDRKTMMVSSGKFALQ